jgi:hypothetical protein
MDFNDGIEARHSVRSYTAVPLSEEERAALSQEIARSNETGNLHMRLVVDEPEAFSSLLAHYGKFRNVSNYLVLAGTPAPSLEQRCGYFGERIVLAAQELGLSSCWVGGTFKRRLVKRMASADDRLVLVVALGHGEGKGHAHRSKSADAVTSIPEGTEVPAWFGAGVDAALKAPTAMNQQSFEVGWAGRTTQDGIPFVSIRSKGGPFSAVDLGIVRLHFEIGAAAAGGRFAWEDGWTSFLPEYGL